MGVLMPRQDLTSVDRRWAAHYATGDVVRYARGSAEHGLDAGAYARVTGMNAAQNTLTVVRRMGCGDGRPYVPGKKRKLASTDSSDRPMEIGRQIGDDIKSRVTSGHFPWLVGALRRQLRWRTYPSRAACSRAN